MKKNYVFKDKGFQSLAIHEFGHSFANLIVLQHEVQIKRTEVLFKALERDMVLQGYSNWESCMIEHFVRAGEVIVMDQLGNQRKSKELLQDYRDNRKFIYIDFIIQKLKEYRFVKKFDYQQSVTATLTDLEKYYLKE